MDSQINLAPQQQQSLLHCLVGLLITFLKRLRLRLL